MIAVVGGGVSGLCAAWRARALGAEVVLFEARKRVGGSIRTVESDGALYDSGATSTLLKHDSVRRLFRDTGLDERVTAPGPDAKTRFILHRGRLEPLPSGLASLIGTGLFSAKDKLGLLAEPFRKKAPADAEESVSEFAVRRLGKSFLDNAVGPFIGNGIFAGDPDRLAVKHALPALWRLEQEHGSLFRGALRGRSGAAQKLISFSGGMKTLPETLAASLGPEVVRRGTSIDRARKVPGGFLLEGTSDDGPISREVTDLVVAIPGHGVPHLLEALGAKASLFGQIAYASVANVFSIYDAGQLSRIPKGFGFLRSRIDSGRRLLGCIFTSSLWPGRVRDGNVGVTCFYGGRLDPGAAALPAGELEALAHRELAPLLGIRGEPIRQLSHAWRPAIPQPEKGHGRFLDAALDLERANPGLHLLGNYLGGVSVADCMDRALSLDLPRSPA